MGSAERIRNVARLISADKGNIVVLSAMSGTTNTLVEISDYLCKKNIDGAREVLNQLEAKYRDVVRALYSSEEYVAQADGELARCFSRIRDIAHRAFGADEEREILAQGELMSTTLMYLYLQEQGKNVAWLPALEFMRTDANGEPDTHYIREHLLPPVAAQPDADLYITQGFI